VAHIKSIKRNMKIKQTKKEVKPKIKFYDGVCESEYHKLSERWNEIICVVHDEIVKYVSDDKLCFSDQENLFPLRSRLTGNYYIDCVSYSKHVNPVGFQISVDLRLTEVMNDIEDDYLGLEVVLFIKSENDDFEIRGVNSSSI